MPYICYIDESGNMETLASATHDAQPVIVIAALFLNQERVIPFTKEFIQIKRNFYPKRLNELPHDLEGLRVEIKGNDLCSLIRKHVANKKEDQLRYRFRYVRALLDLMARHNAKFVASIRIKGIGKVIEKDPVYTTAVQHICGTFQRMLSRRSDYGFVIADFRDPAQNNVIAHAVATQKLKATGDAYPRILEAPTFAISHNHAALQVTDILCSALLRPIATYSYCYGHVTNLHVRTEDSRIKKEFASALIKLQFNYSRTIKQGKTKKIITFWGAYIADEILERNGWYLFH
jgi:hypothetical protein